MKITVFIATLFCYFLSFGQKDYSTVYFGETKVGDSCTRDVREFTVRHSLNGEVNEAFVIQSFELQVGQVKLLGLGNRLDAAMIRALQLADSGTKITFLGHIKGPNDLVSNISAVYYLK